MYCILLMFKAILEFKFFKHNSSFFNSNYFLLSLISINYIIITYVTSSLSFSPVLIHLLIPPLNYICMNTFICFLRSRSSCMFLLLLFIYQLQPLLYIFAFLIFIIFNEIIMLRPNSCASNGTIQQPFYPSQKY
jgi:hypothetical protein